MLLIAAGCEAIELPESAELADPVESSSTLAVYDDPHKLVLPLLVNMMGTQTGSLPFPGWYTAAVIQNTTDQATSIRLTAYAKGGGASGSVTRTIGPYENLVFRADNAGYPGTVGIPLVAAGNFEGSMVVEADHRVAAIAQVSNLEQIATIGGQTVKIGHPQGKASAAHAGLSLRDSGFDTGQDLVYPTMKCSYAGKSTTLFVQNAGPTAGSARLDFVTDVAGTVSHSFTLGVNQSKAVRCSDFGVPAGTTRLGSVSLVYNPAHIRFGAVAIEHATPSATTSPADAVMAHHFHKKTSSSQDMHHAYCPVFKNQFQCQESGCQIATSGIAIVNASGTPADIDVTFHGNPSPPNPASGSTYLQSFLDVPPGGLVVASPWRGTVGGFPPGGYGWAEIHSTHAIVAQANELSSVSQSGQLCVSRRDDDRPVDELFVPSFKSGFPNPISPSAANTKVTLLNLGSQPASITAAFTCRGGSSYTVYRTAAPRTTMELGPGSIPTGLLCAVRISSPAARLVGAVQESTEGLSIAPRDSMIYEAIRFD